MNKKVKNKFTFSGDYLDRINNLAQKDLEFWQNKNGQAQCLNTFDSCFRGIVGELVASAYIKECYKLMDVECGMRQLGIEERKRGVTFTKGMKNFGDIIAGEKNGDGTFKLEHKFEVKTIASHHPYGQILPYHVNKYCQHNIDYVIFVVVTEGWDEDGNPTVTGEVYESKSPIEIKQKWKIKNNWYGNPCYTSPEYI